MSPDLITPDDDIEKDEVEVDWSFDTSFDSLNNEDMVEEMKSLHIIDDSSKNAVEVAESYSVNVSMSSTNNNTSTVKIIDDTTKILYIQLENNIIYVHGETYPIKDELKAFCRSNSMKYNWNKFNVRWELTSSFKGREKLFIEGITAIASAHSNIIVKVIRNDNTTDVNEETSKLEK